MLLFDAGPIGYFNDPGAGEAVVCEFAPRRRQQLFSGGDRIASLRLCTIGSSFEHFQPDS
jgi:hypothetical protein